MVEMLFMKVYPFLVTGAATGKRFITASGKKGVTGIIEG